MDSLRQSRFLFLLVILTTIMVDVTSAVCTEVHTSEGIVDLNDGDYACAALAEGESESDVGSRFLWCVGARVYEYSCGALRWSSKTNACTWPTLRDCGAATASATITTTAEATTAASSVGNNESLTTCSNLTCQLPECFCSGATPTAVPLRDMPMFVMVTFDDAVTSVVASAIYNEFLINNAWNLTNPNGCPPQAAFFVSHNYTDYGLVDTLYQAGHEIATHTVNHTSQETSYSDVLDEIEGQRSNIVLRTSIPEDEIVGFRSPFLKIYGDVQYQILSDRHFLYDSSLFNVEISTGRRPLWPFTLDYPVDSSSCLNSPCPKEPHPGVWEVPLNGWLGDNGFSCSMIDACSIHGYDFSGTKEDYLRFFRRNFYDHFYPSKVPMHMFTHASIFLRSDGAKDGFRAFLEEITELDDVWLVTPSQVLAWMRSPVSHQELRNYQTRSCA